ncbi:MAG TPA: glutamine--fructose-6-phosphate transaminase (isomerizing) [Candidatus Saccharimonadales bacterium]|nr:glutamine--fructose-6-phosphate transaminase (isomerizing) [Candidatus Saccharimonadales bacterium]
MCGIAGCVGHEHAPAFVLESLETLQERGYDSAGIALETDEGLEIVKVVGKPSLLRGAMDLDHMNESSNGTAIGHTRWATHGAVNEANTHPHTNESGSIAVVCNGIIENHSRLRQEIIAEMGNPGLFTSDTDTEVVPHWFNYYMEEGLEPDEAFRKTLLKLEGAFAILATVQDAPGTLYVARRGSNPMVLGATSTGHLAGSNPSVIVGHTKNATFMENNEMAVLSEGAAIDLRRFRSNKPSGREPEDIGDIYRKEPLGEFPHYMLKEISESADTVRAAIAGRVRPEKGLVKLGGLEDVKGRLNDTERIIIVACGTSYYAGLIGERLIEEIAGIPVEVDRASEFIYKDQPLGNNTTFIAISQSGETADTISALEEAEEHGLLKLGIVNAPASEISRITDAGVYCQAGPEVSVASTKAFTSQVTVLTEIALALAQNKGVKNQALLEELVGLPDKIEELLADTSAIREAAKKYADSKGFMYIGRGYNYPSAMEGALKLMEITYIQANGYGAGEMKHGPISLIEKSFPTMAIATDSRLLEKTMSNVQEIYSRGGPIIALANPGNTDIEALAHDIIYVPRSMEQTQPILNGIALQLFAYYVAVEKGLNVDQPRNLAKSVTVE